MSRFLAFAGTHRRGLAVAAGLLVTFGIGVLAGRLTDRETIPAAEDVSVISVSAADNPQGAVRASTRRLRLTVDLGGGCVGDDATRGRIVRSGARETPHLVRLAMRVRPGAEPSGFCFGVGPKGVAEVELPHPIGRREIVNLAGTAHVQRVSYAHRFSRRTDYRFRGEPVIVPRAGRGGRSLRVVVRVNRELGPGTRLRLDESRALAPLTLTDRRRHCYAAAVSAGGDPERAPQLADARPGHHLMVSLVLPDGRYLLSRPGRVSSGREAEARVRGSRLLGALGCVARG